MKNQNDILTEPCLAQSTNLNVAVVTETFPPEVNGVAMTLGRIVKGLIDGRCGRSVDPRGADTHLS